MNNIKTKITQSNNQRVVLFQLVILLVLVLNWFTSCSNSGKISRINKQQVIGVQLANGEVVTGETSKVNYRSDSTIRAYVQKLAYLSFNWNTKDVKVEIAEVKAKLPGNAYASTFAFTSHKDFRASYAKEFSQLISQATGDKTNIQSSIRINYISDKPVKLKDGLWEVIIVADWVGMSGEGREVFTIPYSKKLLLKATPIGGNTGFIPDDETTALQTIIDEISQYGLTVIGVKNYDPE